MFFFPSAIYGKEEMLGNPIRTKATSLSRYYDENKECLLLGFGSSKKERQRLYNISAFSNGHFKVARIGRVKKISTDLSFCQTGIYYSLRAGKNGELVLSPL